MTTTIRHDMVVKGERAAAYAALTTQEGIQGWWSRDCQIGSGVGAVHTMRFAKDDRVVEMRFVVEALEPDARVRWRCTENGNPIWPGTVLEWTLSDVPGGTRIQFAHGELADAAHPAYAMTVEGWKHFVASLAGYLERGQGQPW